MKKIGKKAKILFVALAGSLLCLTGCDTQPNSNNPTPTNPVADSIDDPIKDYMLTFAIQLIDRRANLFPSEKEEIDAKIEGLKNSADDYEYVEFEDQLLAICDAALIYTEENKPMVDAFDKKVLDCEIFAASVEDAEWKKKMLDLCHEARASFYNAYDSVEAYYVHETFCQQWDELYNSYLNR